MVTLRDASTGDDPEDRKEWLASVVWTIGANELIYQHQDSKGASNSGIEDSADCKSDTVAYKYIFSKRTFFIAQYMRTDNKDLATCSFGTTATFPVKPGNDVRGAAIGLQHVF